MRDSLRRKLTSLCLLLIACAGTGCTAFERDWRACHQFANPCDSFAGRWEGTWHSESTGHKGKLRAIITPTDGDNLYHVRFKATYAFIIPYQFDIPMTVTTDDTGTHFEGQADLGWLAGGNYTYTGEARHGCFQSTYCTKKDTGTFTMSKLDAGCPSDGGSVTESAVDHESEPEFTHTAESSRIEAATPTFEPAE